FYEGVDVAAVPKEDQGGAGTLTPAQKKRLITIALETIRLYVSEGKTMDVQEGDERLNQQEGAFVTIHKHGQLRGCIGNIVGRQPLYLTVRDMAVAAAAQDPRFNPVSKEELREIDIEISVLSEPRPAASPEEIQMGVHGVIVKRGFHQGVFLPQVATETGWSREEFLSQLCGQKAGLPPDAWKDPRTQLLIFTATVFSESDVQ
ncbi:MAG TPA: AmmeMemoRadiSam system protein A, partial [Candidatus Bathyarchaeia archaeon]|nr:AmmeMemoRadiSam system protein A [Candidatus Bathyarchaeia archaeon]